MRFDYKNRPQSSGREKCKSCDLLMLGIGEDDPRGWHPSTFLFCDCPEFSDLHKMKTFLVYPDESAINYEVGDLVEIKDKMYQVIQVDHQHNHIMFRKVILKQ